jgi:arylsulfatase A-like enzyme
VAPEPYNALYDPARLPGFVRAASAAEEAAQHPWLAYQLGRPLGRAPADERRLRRLAASYLGLVREVDDQLGRLFDFLRASGEWDRTLVLFTSDHGEQLGDHWLLGKCGYFDQSYHVPLVVRDPRREADRTRGRVVRAFTENVDVMPTLLEWLGLQAPPQCDGASLLPFLYGPGPSRWRAEAHWEFDFRDERGEPEQALGLTPHQCTLNVIRGERFKYVHFAGLEPLFFDLEKDPDERTNLAADPGAAPLVLEWAQKLLSWRMRHDEQALTHVFLTPRGPIERRAPRA